MESTQRFLTKISKRVFSEYGNNLSDLIIVFPSRRASVFFTEELTKFISKVNEEDYKKTLDTLSQTQQNFQKKEKLMEQKFIKMILNFY